VDRSLGWRTGEPVRPQRGVGARDTLAGSQITTACLRGGLDRMFVTSASVGREDEPSAGALFEVDVGGVKGLAPAVLPRG